MKSVTLRFVFWLDINMVCASTLSNAIASMFALENTRRVNFLLMKARDILNTSFRHPFQINMIFPHKLQIDKDLSMLDPKNCLHSEKEKRKIKKSIIGVIVLFTVLISKSWATFKLATSISNQLNMSWIILAVDFIAWLRLAQTYQSNEEIHGHSGEMQSNISLIWLESS